MFVSWCILVMPFFAFAEITSTTQKTLSANEMNAQAEEAYARENDTVIGSNLGLDFYSRIDDASDKLAQNITKRRLSEKWTFWKLGCKSDWISREKIYQKYLDDMKAWDTGVLTLLAQKNNVILTTESELTLRECLVEKYDAIVVAAHQDQNAFETVGNIWLYMDGDTDNSDYDLVTDISVINEVIFKKKYPYTGTKNANARAIADMISGKPIAPLFPKIVSPNTQGWWTAWNTTTPVVPNPGSSTPAWPLPWADVCSVSNWPNTSPVNGIFGDDFFDDIGSSLAGNTADRGFVFQTSGRPSSSAWSSTSRFGNSESKDFYHTTPCDGIFCITFDMKMGSQNLLSGWSTPSIESLLEEHSKMMEPISWGSLGQTKMTSNTFEPLYMNGKIKIVGGGVYLVNSPQVSKQLEKEATQSVLDAKFDLDFKCAMNEAWLQWDAASVNGFIWKWYVRNTAATLGTVNYTEQTLWPVEVDNLAGCYDIRMGNGSSEAYNWLSTDLNEIQGFTRSMLDIVEQILEVDQKKLDHLKSS